PASGRRTDRPGSCVLPRAAVAVHRARRTVPGRLRAGVPAHPRRRTRQVGRLGNAGPTYNAGMQTAVLERADQIPVIDFAPFRDASGKKAVADAIREAAESIGFFYLKNHGLAQSTLDEAFAASRRFFDLPVE